MNIALFILGVLYTFTAINSVRTNYSIYKVFNGLNVPHPSVYAFLLFPFLTVLLGLFLLVLPFIKKISSKAKFSIIIIALLALILIVIFKI